MKNKEELKQELDELKQKYDSIDEYKKEFHEHFETIDKNNTNTKVLRELFFSFIDQLPQNSKIYDYIFNELTNVENELIKTLDDKQKQLFSIYDYLQSEFLNDYGLESFIHGFTLANELKVESNNYSNSSDLIKEQIEKLKNKQ